MARYTVLRFLIFFGCLGLLWLLGLRSPEQRPWLLVGSALLSIVISYFALRPFREQTIDQLTRQVQARVERRGATDEDVEDSVVADTVASDAATTHTTSPQTGSAPTGPTRPVEGTRDVLGDEPDTEYR